MGNKCNGCLDKEKIEEDLNQLGMDLEGVNENFQYHENLLLNKGINLNIYDMLLRKAVSPMHLMSVDVVMKELEEV